MAGEKTEKGTSKRRNDERKKGNVFLSREIVTVASLLIMFTALKALLPMITEQLTSFIRYSWELSLHMDPANTANSNKLFIDSFIVYAICALPLLLISSVVGIIFTFAQTKMLFSSKRMEFKFSNLSLLKGIKRLVSMRGLVELVKALLKISVLGVVLYNSIKKYLPQLPQLFDMTPMQAVVFLGEIVTSIVNTVAAVFIILAIADYVYQWWEYEKNIRMSKDEIKEEYKQTEGDPQLKGKIKDKQRQMSMSRMMQNVPTADVVVRNPTHFAVAIKYDPESGRAPRIIAKGADHIAMKIIEVAEQHDVTITENVPLARALYSEVELEWEIPEKFYQPVAEVLAFVYSIKNKKIPPAKQ